MMYLPGELLLKIEDDGIGFEVTSHDGKVASRSGIGTHNMYYRASLIGGRFTLQSSPGKGTVAQLTLPTT
jgi:signal transduction histidine kinase